MNDPYDMPTCSTCGDVAMYCKCNEKLNDEWNKDNYHIGQYTDSDEEE